MNEGRLVQLGTARDLYEHPANRFVASFLGEANLFRVLEQRPVNQGWELEIAEGVRIRAAVGRGSIAFVRPESIRIGPTDGSYENRLMGRVADAIYTAGSLRYRVALPSGATVTIRQPSERSASLHAPGIEVEIAWRALDTILVEED
jgi:putative spermidine/putrescine transport system ATP-binding protein